MNHIEEITMVSDDYNVGDRVYNAYDSTKGYGTVVRKNVILHVKWDNMEYNEFIKDTPENGLTVRLAAPKIRDEKLKGLGI